MNEQDLLAQSALFAPLPAAQRAALASLFVKQSHDKDDYLFFEGEPAEWLVLVTEGRVKMIKHSESGRETILGTFGPGLVLRRPGR